MARTIYKDAVVRDLLLMTARSRPRLDDGARIRACLAAEPDWTTIVATALAHGVAGLLCRRLLVDAADLLPADICNAATHFLDEASDTYASGVTQLLDLLTAFTAAGVISVPFKGPALAQAVYAKPALRGFRDLDILIGEADLPAVLKVLHQRGYRSQYPQLRERHLRAYHRYNGQDILFAEGRFPVEPHWQFGQRTLAACLDIGAMLSRCVPMMLAGQVISVLSPEDALLVATFHGAKEEWVSLKGVVDVGELLVAYPNLDWDTLLERAQQAGVRRIVLLGVHLAGDMLDAPVPNGVRYLITADKVLLRLAAGVTDRMLTAPVVERSVFALSMFRWRVRERPRDRFRYVMETITTVRIKHFQMVDLPDRLGFLYPVVKVVHDYIALPLWLAVRFLTSHFTPARRRGKGDDAA